MLNLPMLLTDAEAAARLNVSAETIARERRRGRLGYILVGRRVRIREDQLAAYLTRDDGCASTSATTTPTGPGSGTSAGPTNLDAEDAHRLAQEITRPRRRP
jgi:excisionase family DNA binding protein